MAKISIAGEAVVIKSAATMEDIKTLEKYSPKDLCLYEVDEDGCREEVFRVMTCDCGNINQFGACFSNVTRDDEKLACITMVLPDGVVDAEKFIIDNYGLAIMRLNRVEEQFEDALKKVEADRKAVEECITTVM